MVHSIAVLGSRHALPMSEGESLMCHVLYGFVTLLFILILVLLFPSYSVCYYVI